MVGIRAISLLALLAVVCSRRDAETQSRGVMRSGGQDEAQTLGSFDPKESAALFVGVRSFPHDPTLNDVRYAVDDAIDLAFVLALDPRVHLVEPAHIILALSGDPQKAESRQNLQRLIAAGATVRSAAQVDILSALEEQANAAGSKGILVFAFATHGVSYEGTQYLLNATSVLRHRETTLSESKIREIASQSDAARSLILVDACRERLSGGVRSGGPDPRSAASLIQAMSGIAARWCFPRQPRASTPTTMTGAATVFSAPR